MLIDIDLSTGKNMFYVCNISSTARLQTQRSFIKQDMNEQHRIDNKTLIAITS